MGGSFFEQPILNSRYEARGFIMRCRASPSMSRQSKIITPVPCRACRPAKARCRWETLELAERGDDSGERVSTGTMRLAKGLEFKAVAVMACDEDALPLRSRIDSAADEAELEDVYDTERQLLYVAATRARDRLLVTGVKPGRNSCAILNVVP